MAAKRLLEAKGLAWEEINLSEEPQRRQEMLQKADGRHTVPQIFINGTGVGGYDEISALEQRGDLDAMLES